jgi:hypothetical protein
MERKGSTILLNHPGWKARKHSAKGGVFFLTFPFILTRHLDDERSAALVGPRQFEVSASLALPASPPREP